MITFKRIKIKVIVKAWRDNYKQISQNNEPSIMGAKNMDELVNVLGGLGFNESEAYDFIFESIIKPEPLDESKGI